ncbi:hypothetical protein [Flagellimonas marinaquae]
MLDKTSGALHLGEGIEIGPHIDLTATTALHLGNKPEVIGFVDAEKQQVHFRNVRVEHFFFTFRMQFSYNRLLVLELLVSPLPIPITGDWENWNFETEMKHLEQCNAWLQEQVGNEREFDWGCIWSGYDSLGGYSSIKIKYY